LLNDDDEVHVDDIMNKSPKVYSDVSLAEKIDAPSSTLAAVGPLVDLAFPGTQTVTSVISYVGTVGYYSAPFYTEHVQEKLNKKAKKPQSFVDKEKKR
jgi:hypothetical protein